MPSENLHAAMGVLLDTPALRRAEVGIEVVRVDDGTVLYSHAGDTKRVPASNVKLFTTAAALSYLSPDFQFFTDIHGQIDANGRIGGDLVLRGDGDPYLIPERIWYLASRLSFLGVREVAGDIVVDDTYFAGPRMALGSEQDHSSAAYMAPAGAVSVGFNAIMVHVLPAVASGQPAHIAIDPASNYGTIRGQVHTVSTGRTSVQVSVTPDGATGSVVQVSGRIRVGDPGRAFWRRIDNPPIFAGQVLRSALTQVGIAVHGGVRTGALLPGTPRLLQYSSPRLAELLGPLNKYSSNFMATQVALALGAKRFGAPGTWAKAHRAIEAFLADEVQIPRGSYSLNNASGLHDVNAVTPHQVVQLLTYMQRQPQMSFEYINSLAVGAGSGTLQDRMLASPASHLVRAKTGTLAIASALSGYVTTRDQQSLAFAFLINHYSRIHDVWAAQDKFAALLADLNLTPPATAGGGTVLPRRISVAEDVLETGDAAAGAALEAAPLPGTTP
jgi:D-alanyl-D-alanine carboxypeptidase/D-alanyl-D-alanine-endopeptidase (penicillin-binding protein 4)